MRNWFSVTEIGNELNISTQAVSKTLERAIPKFFLKVKEKLNLTSYDAFCAIIEGWNLEQNDIQSFLNYLPSGVKSEIYWGLTKNYKKVDK